ncbi:hypothetical protein SLS55_006592 [Diplodia seriata]|uniref:Ubiquitin-like protease family profile domain-containing protein n=1 Tax=Diplodia seriata TaxID=420778 RepID=A0ABR3CEM7_9PEZI
MPSGSEEFMKVEDTMNPKAYGRANISQEALDQEQLQAASAAGKQRAVTHEQSSEPIQVDSDDDLQLSKDPGREQFIMNTLLQEIEGSPKRKLFGQTLHTDHKQPSRQGDASHKNENDLYLVLEPKKERCTVHGKDGIIPIGKGVLSVEWAGVNRVVYGKDDSTKVWVDGPTIDKEPYKRFMEFTNTKDRDDFVKALPPTTKHFGRDGGDMDKAFARAAENLLWKSIPEPVDAGVEDALLESRDSQRRQETDLNGNKERTHEKASANTAANGRPRTDTRLISQLQVDPSRGESSTRTSRAVRAGDQPGMGTSRTLATARNTRANDHDDDISKAECIETAEPKNSWPPMRFPPVEWKQPLVYPPTGRQRAQVYWADLFKLSDDEFLNDSIISFYMTWAAKQAEERGNLRPDKVYWFNTYFYSTLTKLAKGQKAINYAGVQRWTSKIDIFSYDYVVVPINEDQHWYLAIICNLPALAKKVQNQEEAVEKERSVEMKDLPKGGLAAQVHGLLSEKQEPPSESTKESEDSGDAMEVDQPVRSDGVTASEKFGEQQNGTRDGDETMATTPQLTADESRNDVLDEIKVLPDGQEDTSKLSPGGKKGRKKSGPPVRKLDAEQPVIIMLDSLELTHPKTTKNLKAYLVEEGKAKRGMDIDIKTLLGTTAKCIPTQDNFCDCGIFVCLYFQKFINDADNFVHKIFRKEMDKIKDWPDISPPKTRREILGLLLRLEEEQSKERSEQRKKKKAEKRRLLEGVENESIVIQASPTKDTATNANRAVTLPPRVKTIGSGRDRQSSLGTTT